MENNMILSLWLSLLSCPRVQMVQQVLRVWLASVVLLDFLDNVVKEVSPACLDPL